MSRVLYEENDEHTLMFISFVDAGYRVWRGNAWYFTPTFE